MEQLNKAAFIDFFNNITLCNIIRYKIVLKANLSSWIVYFNEELCELIVFYENLYTFYISMI